MHSQPSEARQLTLLVQRWVDADLLLPAEGEAILAEIAAWLEADIPGEKPTLPLLEALVRTDRLNGEARETLRCLAASDNNAVFLSHLNPPKENKS